MPIKAYAVVPNSTNVIDAKNVYDSPRGAIVNWLVSNGVRVRFDHSDKAVRVLWQGARKDTDAILVTVNIAIEARDQSWDEA